MPYEFYKIAHIVMIVIFFAMTGLSLYGQNLKHIKIVHGITTLLILVTGMGLMARLGIGHTAGWPFWIKYKMFIWAILGISAPVVAKRAPRYGIPVFWFFVLLLVSASYMANYKP